MAKDGKGRWTYTPMRNDEKFNQHNRFIVQTWKAYTDGQIIISEYAIINYLIKYAAKSQSALKNLIEMFEESVQSRVGDDQTRKLYTSFIMKIIGDRDIGACET